MKSIISIVIPVYNVEEYLERCLNSLIKQTYKDYEIVLIDDGSTDRSALICDLYTEKYKFIKCIHIPNSGVSNARNMGINNANGDYLVFIDPDDWVHEDYLMILSKMIMQNDVQLGVVNYKKSIGTSEQEIVLYTDLDILTQRDALNELADSTNYMSYIWNKIYALKIIRENDIFFEREAMIWEDLLFNTRYLSCINNVAHNKSQLYYYFVRQDSAVNQGSYKKDTSKLMVAEELESIMSTNIKEGKVSEKDIFVEFIQKLYIEAYLHDIVLNQFKHGVYDCQRIRKYLSCISKYSFRINTKEKILYLLLMYCPRIVYAIYLIKNVNMEKCE